MARAVLIQIGSVERLPVSRIRLALKLKPMIAKQQRQKQVDGGKEKVQQKSVEPTTTQKELAKVAGVSHDTIHKVETIENSGNESLKEQVRTGEISINQGYNAVQVAKAEAEGRTPYLMRK